MAYDFRDVSAWLESPHDLLPPLTSDIRADVIVVGGGYTGLNAAIALKEAGVDVVLLEMDFCGMGASGRNAGHLTPTIGKDFPTLVKYVGKERAIEYARFADRAVGHAEATIRRYDIACDYAPVGNIVGGMHERHREPMMRSAELAGNLGVGLRFLPEEEMQQRRIPPAFRFGMLEHCGGHLNPGKYVLGLRRAAINAGVRIFENSRVTEISDDQTPICVRTAHGSVTADKLVLATNAYTPATLGILKHRIFPMRVSLFQTSVLTEAQRADVGWSFGEGIYTAHESMESYRLTAEGRIVGGSKFVQYGYGSTLPDGNLPDIFNKFERLLPLRFPQLPGLQIETFWGGWIGMTLDFLPLNYANKRGTTFYGMGYNGHGIAQATLGGAMLADQVLGRPNENVDLLKRRIIPLPPEPLRWMTVKALDWYFARVDKAVDADLRAAS